MKYLEIVMIFFELKFKEIGKGINFIFNWGISIFKEIWDVFAIRMVKASFVDFYEFLTKHPALTIGIGATLLQLVLHYPIYIEHYMKLYEAVRVVAPVIFAFMLIVMTFVNTLIVWVVMFFIKWIGSNANQTMKIYAERHR